MPGGDITHPVPDLTGYITEGQVVLSAEIYARGLYPPIDPLSSLSRLMRRGAGPGRTREDHLDLAAQTLALLATAREVSELAQLLGEASLSPTERLNLEFAEAFQARFVAQRRDEAIDLEATLARAWEVVSILPRRELSMLPVAALDRWYQEQRHDEVGTGSDEPAEGRNDGDAPASGPSRTTMAV
jgi:V/A-type H+-transporting ATPase subunit B